MPWSERLAPWLLLTAALAFAGTWCARRYALRRRLLDAPGERRSHSTATPRGGGIAIVLALLPVLLAWAWFERGMLPMIAALGTGAVALAGWVDDHRPVSPWLRLAVHALASLALAVAVALQGGLGWPVAIAFLAPLALTNVWNFMDGIDGIASVQAILVALAVAGLTGGSAQAVALAVAVATLGFLPFNFPRARIFLGDVGSGALGYLLGVLLVLACLDVGTVAAWLLLPLAPFLVDAGMTLARRVVRGERWWTPHVQHAYQVAARRWGHPAVTTAYGLAAAAGGVLALAARGDGPSPFMSSMLAAWYTSAAILWLGLQRLERGGGWARRDNKEQS